MTAQPESRLVREAIAAIRAAGGKVIKTHGSAFSRLGTPDIIACVNGRTLALECKTATGKTSTRQLFELDEWRDAGAIAYVVRNEKDVEDAITEAFE